MRLYRAKRIVMNSRRMRRHDESNAFTFGSTALSDSLSAVSVSPSVCLFVCLLSFSCINLPPSRRSNIPLYAQQQQGLWGLDFCRQFVGRDKDTREVTDRCILCCSPHESQKNRA